MKERADNQNCPSCGMSVASGSSPTQKDGTTYCCGGCANGSKCTCPGHNHG